MSFDEINLKNKIQEQTKDLEVPESLMPEAVEKRLSGTKKKKGMKPIHYLGIAAAACFILVIGVAGGKIYDVFNPGHCDAERVVADADTKGKAADGGENGAGAEGQEAGAKAEAENAVRTAEDYDEVYRYIKAEQEARQSYGTDLEMNSGFLGGVFSEDGAMAGGAEIFTEESVMEDAKSADGGNTSFEGISQETGRRDGGEVDYSDTNTREEDVGEADIVKTDGKHLFILHGQRVEIIGIEQDEMKELGVIVLDDEVGVEEIYLQDDRLVVTYTESRREGEGEYATYRTYAVAETFDVGNPSSPKSVGKIAQSGRYYTTRIKDGYVYLFSNYYADYEVARSYEDGFVPVVDGQKIEAGNVYLPMLDTARKYLVVSSFSLKEPDVVVDNKAIFGDTDLCYVSGENIYVCENSYAEKKSSDMEESKGREVRVSQTSMRKIAYKDGKLTAVGQADVEGTINDSFCIDEYEGNLRLVTTVRPSVSYDDDGIMPLWLGGIVPRATQKAQVVEDVEMVREEKDSNSLYVLDENLKELARIEGLAEDERVYSARFMGDAGYFVTFRETDPLFSVDLSNPKKPKIIGELKIPGFSDYLHPYGDGKLLGIGMEVDEEGMTTDGVKLSMFDISDPANVTEAHKYVLEGTYSTDVTYNYKAAFVDVKKNLIGLNAFGAGARYYIFAYGENGFECLFSRDLMGLSSDVRALYAGERLYLVAGNTVVSYRLKTFEKIDDIVLGAAGR